MSCTKDLNGKHQVVGHHCAHCRMPVAEVYLQLRGEHERIKARHFAEWNLISDHMYKIHNTFFTLRSEEGIPVEITEELADKRAKKKFKVTKKLVFNVISVIVAATIGYTMARLNIEISRP